MKQDHGDTSFEIVLVLVRDQFLDAYPSPVQDVDDPVDDRKVVVRMDL
jgi:hypothetical protein